MSEEKHFDALPPGIGPSDKEIFEEAIQTQNTHSLPVLDFKPLQPSSGTQEGDAGYCIDMAHELASLIEQLSVFEKRPREGMTTSERQLFEECGDVHSTAQTVVDLSSRLSSPSDCGDLLDAATELIVSAFFLGKYSGSGSIRETGKQHRVDLVSEALRKKYADDPIKKGWPRLQIIAAVEKELGFKMSPSTFDRARAKCWA